MKEKFQNFLLITLSCFLLAIMGYGSKMAYQTYTSLKAARTQTKVLNQHLEKIAKTSDSLNLALDNFEKKYTVAFNSTEKSLDSACNLLKEIRDSLP